MSDIDDNGHRYSSDIDAMVDPNGNPVVEAPIDEERFLASMARFMIEGQERTEARLVLQCSLEATEEFDDWDNRILRLRFRGPRRLYDALGSSGGYGNGAASSLRVFEAAAEALMPEGFTRVIIERGMAYVSEIQSDWRNELLAVLEGRDVDNQALAFSDVVTWQGLRFRSRSEVKIAEALDKIPGVMFLPNCRGRVGSKERRRNLEADFVVMFNGVWGVLEVDGPHHEGKAAHDHDRDRPFHHHGAAIVQRYESMDCFRDPDSVVLNFMALLKAKARR